MSMSPTHQFTVLVQTAHAVGKALEAWDQAGRPDSAAYLARGCLRDFSMTRRTVRSILGRNPAPWQIDAACSAVSRQMRHGTAYNAAAAALSALHFKGNLAAALIAWRRVWRGDEGGMVLERTPGGSGGPARQARSMTDAREI